MIDLEEIKKRLAFVPPRVIGTLHQTLLTLITHDLPGVMEELAAARAEIAEHRASLRAKEQTIGMSCDHAVELLHEHFDPLWDGNCNANCCEHNKGECPTVKRDNRP